MWYLFLSLAYSLYLSRQTCLCIACLFSPRQTVCFCMGMPLFASVCLFLPRKGLFFASICISSSLHICASVKKQGINLYLLWKVHSRLAWPRNATCFCLDMPIPASTGCLFLFREHLPGKDQACHRTLIKTNFKSF